MFSLGARAILRGFRTSDTQRLTMGALLVLAALYRRTRRSGGLITSHELREGDEVTIRVPRRWQEDPAVLTAASATAHLDDDLLAAPPAE